MKKASARSNLTEALILALVEAAVVGIRVSFKSQTEKLLPQPQLPVAFGLSNLKPRLSMPSR